MGGASSMHPIDFDGDGDIDIVKSSPIGIVWLENHGVDKEWETHIISLNQNIKDAVAAHKRHRKFVDVMEGRGFAPVSALSDEPPVVVQALLRTFPLTSPAMWWGRRRATPSRNCSKWCLIR